MNGVEAPLYYVSPTQLNIQIPYQTAANSSATLTINNNGQITSPKFQTAAASPGIFMNNPTSATIVPNGTAASGADCDSVYGRLRGRHAGDCNRVRTGIGHAAQRPKTSPSLSMGSRHPPRALLLVSSAFRPGRPVLSRSTSWFRRSPGRTATCCCHRERLIKRSGVSDRTN